MTNEDETRAAWLNLLGSGTVEGDALHEGLAHLHDVAEASHCGIRPHRPMTAAQAAVQERYGAVPDIDPAVLTELRQYGTEER